MERARVPPPVATAGGMAAAWPVATAGEAPGEPWVATTARADRSRWSGAATRFDLPSVWVSAPILLGFLFSVDPFVKQWAQEGWQGEFGDDVASVGEALGEPAVMAVAAGGAVIVGAFQGSEGLKRSTAIVAGMLAGPINNAAIKYVTGRVRPSSTDSPLDFQPFSGNVSFPSGHVSVPFSVAGALVAGTDRPWVGIPFYAAGLLTGFARIYDNAHWFSDVVASAVIASVVSQRVTDAVLDAWGLGDGGHRGEVGRGLRVAPIASASMLGVDLRF